MTVSIIMPVYNAAPYLAEAIRSCLSQNSPFELIIINDASKDSSQKIIDWFVSKNSNIVSLTLPENHGPAFAMNRGIEKATGDIICFAAADDIQERDKVKIILEAFQNKIDFCYTGYYHASIKGQIHSEVHPKPLTVENIKANDCASGGGLALTKKVALKIPFREDLRVNEDSAILVDLYKAKLKYAVVDIPTFRYRLLQTGISYSKKKEVEAITEKLMKEL